MEIEDHGASYFQMAVEAVPTAIVMLNHEGKIVLVNVQTEKLFGYKRRELLGQPVEILLPEFARTNHPDLGTDFFVQTQLRLAGTGRDLLAQRKDGKQFPVEIGVNPVETGGETWVLCSVGSITERRHAEAMLRESEERFRNIADTAPVMIWISGTDKLCTFFNKAWLDFTGRSMEQELGHGWTGNVHPEDLDRCWSIYSSSFDARRSFRMEYRLRGADGRYRWVLDDGAPRFAADGVFAGYVGSCVDIAEVKRAQEDALAGQKLEGLGQLANGIAHDFNNLLGGIRASAELLLAERKQQGSPPEEELLRIETAAVRGGEIVRQLMIYSGEDTPSCEPVDFSSLVEEMLHLLRVSISKHAVLKTELGDGLPTLHANATQIRQVVMNLITNASEAIGERDGVICVTTTHTRVGPEAPVVGASRLPAGDYVKLEVSDTGSGMTPEVRTRMFDPFFTTKIKGRGLGLAAVQGIVRGHNGAIDVESSLRHGTRFTVLLPCANQPAQELRDIPACPAANEAGTVLLVEDEETLRVAVSKMLRRKGFVVIEALDGSAAVDLFRVNEPDVAVILLDMTLPVMNGPEVFVELRRIRPNVKVILTTAYSRESAITAFGGQQPWAFIRKPYGLNDLVKLVRDACLEKVDNAPAAV